MPDILSLRILSAPALSLPICDPLRVLLYGALKFFLVPSRRNLETARIGDRVSDSYSLRYLSKQLGDVYSCQEFGIPRKERSTSGEPRE